MNKINKIKNILLDKIKEYSFVLALFIFFIFSIKPFPSFQFSDGFWLWLPRLGLEAQEILKAHIPFWNEYQFCGTALLADGTSNLLNPVSIFYLFFSSEWAYTVGMILLFFLLVLGTWKYFRIRGFLKIPSAVGTLAFILGGQITFWSLYHGMNLSIALFPWILIAFRLYEKEQLIKWKLLAFFLFFVNMIGGFIQFAFFTAAAVVFEGMKSFSYNEIKKVIKDRGLTIFLAIGASAFIVIPVIETFLFSHRTLVPYLEIVPLPLKFLFMAFWGTSFRTEYYCNYFYYIGIILISFALFKLRRSFKEIIHSPFFIFSLIFPIILLSIYLKIIPLNFQFGVQSDPFRGIFIFIFSLSIIAAQSVDTIINDLKNSKLKNIPAELCIASILCLIIGLYEYYFFKMLNILSLGLIIFAGMLFVKISDKFSLKVKTVILSSWIILLFALNSFPEAFNYLKTSVLHNYKNMQILQWEKKGVPLSMLRGEERVLSLNSRYNSIYNGFFEQWCVYHKIRSIGGYATFYPKTIFMRMRDEGFYPYNYNAGSHYKNDNNLDVSLLSKYGVLYLIDENDTYGLDEEGWQLYKQYDDIKIYKNPKYVGRSYLIDKNGDIIKGAKISDNINSYLKITVDAKKGDTLILADSWFPGWQCYDNGVKAKGFDANGFRGYTFNSSGFHEIEWIYQPKSYILGIIVSISSILLFSLLCFYKIRNGKLNAKFH